MSETFYVLYEKQVDFSAVTDENIGSLVKGSQIDTEDSFYLEINGIGLCS